MVGLILIRRQRSRANLPKTEYKAWDITIAFSILTYLYMLVAPWYPPTKGADGGDVSFWYATYLAFSIGLYFFFFFFFFPLFLLLFY